MPIVLESLLSFTFNSAMEHDFWKISTSVLTNCPFISELLTEKEKILGLKMVKHSYSFDC
jgi:hypothetical protein